MTNEVYIVTNSVVTSLDVLKSVNDLYSSNFTQLLTVMGLLVGVVGAAVVILPLWFQMREAKVRRAETHAEFQAFIEQTREDLETELQEKFLGQNGAVKKEIELLKVELALNWSQVAAVSAHAQMRIALGEKEYISAAENAITAIRSWCICSDHSNVLRTIEVLTTSICPNLKKEDFEARDLLPQMFDELENELNQVNQSGFLSDKLNDLKQARREISKR